MAESSTTGPKLDHNRNENDVHADDFTSNLVPNRFRRSTAMACCSARARSATRLRAPNAGVRPSSLSARTKRNRNPTVLSCRPPARPTTSAGRERCVVDFSMHLLDSSKGTRGGLQDMTCNVVYDASNHPHHIRILPFLVMTCIYTPENKQFYHISSWDENPQATVMSSVC